MNPTLHRMRPWALALCAIALFGACNSDNNNDKILPLVASVVTPAVSGDPVIFFQKSASDTNPTDDTIAVDIMLRTSAPLTFDYIDMEVLFDPGVLQLGQLDWSATPLGDCFLNNGTTLTCLENAVDANRTGDLIIGISRTSSGTSATVTTPTRLMTLRFVGASVGTSMLEFETTRTSGDCEILAEAQPLPIDLNVACDGTGTVVTVAR